MIGMLGMRNLYRVLRESRNAAERRVTVAVDGEGPDAGRLAELLGAQRDRRNAEVVLTVLGGSSGKVRISPSGKAVEKERTIELSALTEDAVGKELAPKLVDAVDEEYLVPLGLAYPPFRRAVCEQVIRNNARQNAIIGALPIPGADMPAITANQGRMVLGLAAVYGEELNLDRARELGAVLAAGFGLRAVSRQLVKFVPVAGWAAAAAIAYAGTLAMGRAAVLYFERGRLPQDAEKEDILRRAMAEARAFVARNRRR
jgi:uncharacterized protein (DUF697 family)